MRSPESTASCSRFLSLFSLPRRGFPPAGLFLFSGIDDRNVMLIFLLENK